MRKFFLVIITAVLFLFISSSPWEGSASVAPEGELPITGFFVSTNSFPRNTIVDITNIETNRSTRVIVANSLESPGLLAIVSREAATLIGMRPGSVTRIRMTQPSEPIAYSRFIEGMSQGIPDFDSGNVITNENFREETITPPANNETPRIADGASQPEPQTENRNEILASSNIRPYTLEPEWGGTNTSYINNLPAAANGAHSIPPSAVVFAETETEQRGGTAETPVQNGLDAAATGRITDENIEMTEAQIMELIAQNTLAENTKIAGDMEEERKMNQAELMGLIAEHTIVDEPVELIEIPEKDVYEHIAGHTIDGLSEKTEYDIIAAEERPPSLNGIYGINPEDIIPGITIAASVPEQTDEEHIMEPMVEGIASAISEPEQTDEDYVMEPMIESIASAISEPEHIDEDYVMEPMIESIASAESEPEHIDEDYVMEPMIESIEQIAEAEQAEEESAEAVAEAAAEAVAETEPEPETESIEQIAEAEQAEEESAEAAAEAVAEAVAETEPETESIEQIAEAEQAEEESAEAVAEAAAEAVTETEPETESIERITEETFSIPRIFELRHGSYYVQLAAFDTVESVEDMVPSIDTNFNPVVYKDGDHWYRVLLGPLNQGESAAVLHRFRSIGFRDAFVRHAR